MQETKRCKPIIFHIDVNSAFLSWEAVYRMKILKDTIDLREIPSAIGGDIEKRQGVILAKSIPAKAYEVQTGESVIAALKKCPQLVLAKPNHALYAEYSKAFMAILREYTPIVEPYSIDEAFMDMTGTEGLYGEALKSAHLIKNRIYEELGFTVNIGVSSNRLLAKMASDFKKPNLVHTLFPEEIKEKMWPMEVRNLFFVGAAAEKKLKRLGIKTIGDLAKADVSLLKLHLNKQGQVIHDYANGIESNSIKHEVSAHKGYSQGMTLPFDITEIEAVKKVLLFLCENVCMRLRKDEVKASCITITIVNMFFESVSHQKTFSFSSSTTHQIYEWTCETFVDFWKFKTPIRQLSIQVSKLSYEKDYQYTFFDTPQNKKYEKLDEALDQIRNKYGETSVKRASFIKVE